MKKTTRNKAKQQIQNNLPFLITLTLARLALALNLLSQLSDYLPRPQKELLTGLKGQLQEKYFKLLRSCVYYSDFLRKKNIATLDYSIFHSTIKPIINTGLPPKKWTPS